MSLLLLVAVLVVLVVLLAPPFLQIWTSRKSNFYCLYLSDPSSYLGNSIIWGLGQTFRNQTRDTDQDPTLMHFLFCKVCDRTRVYWSSNCAMVMTGCLALRRSRSQMCLLLVAWSSLAWAHGQIAKCPVRCTYKTIWLARACLYTCTFMGLFCCAKTLSASDPRMDWQGAYCKWPTSFHGSPYFRTGGEVTGGLSWRMQQASAWLMWKFPYKVFEPWPLWFIWCHK